MSSQKEQLEEILLFKFFLFNALQDRIYELFCKKCLSDYHWEMGSRMMTQKGPGLACVFVARAPSGGEAEQRSSDGARGVSAALSQWTLTALIVSVPPLRP